MPSMPKPSDNSPDIIVAKKLAAGFGAKAVWSNANFSIARGEFIGFLGSNGAGKTTLFRLILGLARPLQGELKVFGRDPARGNARIGYVPQRRIVDSESKIQSIEYVRLAIAGNKWGFSLASQAR